MINLSAISLPDVASLTGELTPENMLGDECICEGKLLKFSDLIEGSEAPFENGPRPLHQPGRLGAETGNPLPEIAEPGNLLPVGLDSNHAIPVVPQTLDPTSLAQDDTGTVGAGEASNTTDAQTENITGSIIGMTVSVLPTLVLPDVTFPVRRPQTLPPSGLPKGKTQPQSSQTAVPVVRNIQPRAATGELAEAEVENAPAKHERVQTDLVSKSADVLQSVRGPELPQPILVGSGAVLPQQLQPVSNHQTTNPSPLGQQIETLIENLSHARENSRIARGDVTLRHAEFGAVAIALERTESDLRASLSSRDPGFSSAAQSALAERAIVAATDTQSANARSQDAPTGQSQASRDAGFAGQGDPRNQHQQTEARQASARNESRNTNMANAAESGPAETSTRDDGVLA